MNTQGRSRNNLLMLTYFTTVASLILCFFGYMVGVAGLIIVSILLSALMYFSVLMGNGKSPSASIINYYLIEREAQALGLAYFVYSIYLSIGFYSLLGLIRSDSSLNTFSYLFLISLTIPALSYLWVVNHKKTDNRDITPKMG